MCSSKSKPRSDMTQDTIAQINGRPVLQPKSNQVPTLDRRNSLKKSPQPKLTTRPTRPVSLISPPISPKPKSPRQPVVKTGKDVVSCKDLSSSSDKVNVRLVPKPKPVAKTLKMPTADLLIVQKPGSIAAARREEVAMKQEERKKKIAHYGRAKSNKKKSIEVVDNQDAIEQEKKRCSFITPNSDPIYVAYHDEEWGVPTHDDNLLFELLVLTGAQVGSDWTSVLKKRNTFREAFSGFDAELVAEFNDKKIRSITTDYGIDLGQVLAAVDNSKQILKVKREFGSFNKYLWGFVKYKPIITQYTSRQKIPVKTSKSESVSKDMVRRGFRFVGPAVIHSFMQAAGMTNDHLVTCPRHLQCTALAAQPPVAAVAPAL
ncbi:PREDICTED: uncharacterized protein LOC104811922 [Tarenaya hassleriana]|uniref:uncharacterized protein LOC104811922 n=1 Tax=Tarenaya hassleriana TaxID=28532 RepID=UPI00053C2EFF|nr:PREDICTED: uncharacterized protein LOC104811922 [Tarenaya hassleriana]